MIVKYHILLSALFAIALFLLTPLNLLQSVIVFFSSVLVDFDHYLLYLFNNREINLKKIYKKNMERRKSWLALSAEEKNNYKRPIFLFHGIEFWIFVLLLSLVYPIFIYVMIGILFHVFLDFIDLFYYKEPMYPKTSQVYNYIQNKKKKKFSL